MSKIAELNPSGFYLCIIYDPSVCGMIISIIRSTLNALLQIINISSQQQQKKPHLIKNQWRCNY